MSDDDYRDAAVIGKYYRRNHVEVSDTCIKDTTRPGPLYATGLQWGSNDGVFRHLSRGRPVVKVTNSYPTRRHGIKVAYEMVNHQQYFTCTRPYYRAGYPLYGPFESSLSDFFHAFEGPYDNQDGTNNTSSSSTTTTIDLRTPTKESTPLKEGEDLRELETISEDESIRRQLESAQKNRKGKIGGYIDLISPPSNNNNNVKKRAHVSSGSGSSSSGSSEGGVDPNHPSQRQIRRRLEVEPRPIRVPRIGDVYYNAGIGRPYRNVMVIGFREGGQIILDICSQTGVWEDGFSRMINDTHDIEEFGPNGQWVLSKAGRLGAPPKIGTYRTYEESKTNIGEYFKWGVRTKTNGQLELVNIEGFWIKARVGERVHYIRPGLGLLPQILTIDRIEFDLTDEEFHYRTREDTRWYTDINRLAVILMYQTRGHLDKNRNDPPTDDKNIPKNLRSYNTRGLKELEKLSLKF